MGVFVGKLAVLQFLLPLPTVALFSAVSCGTHCLLSWVCESITIIDSSMREKVEKRRVRSTHSVSV